MLETDALKEKLEMEIHRFARPPEELSSGDPYFEQLQTMLAIREELENIAVRYSAGYAACDGKCIGIGMVIP